MGKIKGGFIMFVSFNSIFNKKPQAETEVPKAMLEYLNEQLPHGLEYISSSDGRCIIKSDSKELTLGGIKFNPTKEQKKILGENYTQKDVLDYSYNSQEKIPLLLEKDGYITINGQEIPIEKISFNPLLSVEYVSGSVFLQPREFPAAFSITIGDGKYSRELAIKRIPNKSIYIAIFQSEINAPLWIKYTVDVKKKLMKMSISYNLKYARSIRDVVETTMIYNAYCSGKLYLGDVLLDNVIPNSIDKQYDPKSALFWEKVLKIEECLNVQFVFPKENISFEDFQLVEELYQNLINKKPIRNIEKITSVDGDWKKDFNESIGHSIAFTFRSIIKIDLFSVKLSLHILRCIYNTRIKEIQKNEAKTRIIIEDENEEKKQYNCSMIFSNEEELKEYKNKDYDEIILFFQKAKTVEEYLEEESGPHREAD